MQNEVGVTLDTDLTADNLRELVKRYKNVYKTEGIDFPDDPLEQLRTSIYAVFDSWQSERESNHDFFKNIHCSVAI